MPRRYIFAMLALLVFAPPASAKEGDPLDVVRELYRLHAESLAKTEKPVWIAPADRERFFTRELAGLIARAYERNAIDFDFIYDGQDYKITELEIVRRRGSGLIAEVEARFKNFGKPQRLVYWLVQERGAWRISNIRQGRANGWSLTRHLRRP